MGTRFKQGRRIALVFAFVLALQGILPALVSAGALSNTYLRLDRMMTGTATGFQLVFTTSPDAASEDNIRINFGAAFSTFVGNPTSISSASCGATTGATGVPGTLAATGAAGVMNITGVTNLAASTAYCVDVTGGLSSLPAAGEYYADIETRTGTTVDDSAKVALRIVSNDSITVTATVPPTFNFALDANTTAFTSDLSPGTKQTTTARTVTINTNAKTGWVTWLRNSDTNGLYSTGVNANIAPTTPGTAVDVDTAASTEQYVWGVTSTSQVAGVGTTTVASAYDATGGTNEGSGVDNAYRQIASSNGTSQDAVVTIVSAATISPITPAASDYTDTVQVIGAGNF